MDTPTETRFDAIVIGASLGGVQAISQILSSLPRTLNVSILIVLHSGPSSPRLLDAIFSSHTSMKVGYAVEGEEIKKEHIYIAPPDRHLEVRFPGVIHLSAEPKVKHSRPAADRLFQTTVSVYGSRTLGVVLTGGDGDGTNGAKAINAAGGAVIVQDPGDALAPDMPRHVLGDDHPDYCVPLEKIGPLIADLAM
ncbi:chemotaxis protein CheB [Pseudomonas sp. NA-150]|uniref:chemotaxis protein CheB n=1 Tax=Pseudomonas sp. NA-150 TaxID=3367525 RepID=UPI0037C6200A